MGIAPTYLQPSQALPGTYFQQAQPIQAQQRVVHAQPAQQYLAQPAQQHQGAQKHYSPQKIADAWQNHFDAFGAQDLDKIMLDYDNDSVARVYNNADATKKEYKGVAEIRQMFAELFQSLFDLGTLDAPIVDVDEAG